MDLMTTQSKQDTTLLIPFFLFLWQQINYFQLEDTHEKFHKNHLQACACSSH